MIKHRGIVLINTESGARKEFKSLNGAARFLGTTFFNVQRAAMYNGMLSGWKVYEDPDSIRKHIADLEAQIKELES